MAIRLGIAVDWYQLQVPHVGTVIVPKSLSNIEGVFFGFEKALLPCQIQSYTEQPACHRV